MALRQIFQTAPQILAGIALRHFDNILRPTFGHDSATHVAAIRPHVDDPIRTLDHIQIVLDHQDRISPCPPADSAHSADYECPQSAAQWSAHPERKA